MRKDFFHLFDSVPKLLSPLFDACDTPWEMLSKLSDFLLEITKNPPKGYSLLQKEDGDFSRSNGGSLGAFSHSKDGARGAFSRHSGILVGEGVKIEEFSTIKAPAVICRDAEIRQGAYLRGSVFLGEGAIAGHGTEMKNTVLMDGAKAPHLSYLGDSILGKNAHLGAGVILSNLRLDKGEIFVNLGAPQGPDNAISNTSERIPTGRRKLGSIIGDNTEIACGTVLNPGTIIPKNSLIFPK
jgi:NDP-sugar pyrophosphorylase family protein